MDVHGCALSSMVGKPGMPVCMDESYLLHASRVDLHRPKMLIMQFHTPSLWKNASHTNFIHYCKMNLTEFQRYFIVVLVSKLVSLHKKRKKMV